MTKLGKLISGQEKSTVGQAQLRENKKNQGITKSGKSIASVTKLGKLISSQEKSIVGQVQLKENRKKIKA